MKGLKTVGIVDQEVASTIGRPRNQVVATTSVERLRDVLVPRAVARFWTVRDTFDLFAGVRITLRMVVRVQDETVKKMVSRILPSSFTEGISQLIRWGGGDEV